MVLMADWDTLHLVKTSYAEFNELCDAYTSAHLERFGAITSEDKQDVEASRYETKQVSIIEFRNQVQKWIEDTENRTSDRLGSASG